MNVAVLLAGGSGRRMGGPEPKQFIEIAGRTILEHSIRAFHQHEGIDRIIIVSHADYIDRVKEIARQYTKVTDVVAGGKDRAESVHLGMNALSEDIKLAAIHDGARPMATWQLIDRCIRAANTYGAAAPAIPVKDTIKVVTGGVVSSTPDRETLKAVQTPQVFDFDLLRGALQKARLEDAKITDDCSAVENMGMSVKIVEGDERNIKITTPLDLKLAEMILEDMV